MLPAIRVASPCKANWDQMTGDDRVRHCAQCNLDVYDFSAMTEPEIARLISASRGKRLCARLYRRVDGTLLTRDCPIGFRVRVRRISRRAGILISAAVSAASAAAQTPHPAQSKPSSLVRIQNADSGIELTVTDETGAVIPNAGVSILRVKTGTVIGGKTDGTGVFRAVDLGADKYRVSVKMLGFKTAETTITLPAEESHSMKLTVPMSVAGTEGAMMGVVVDVKMNDTYPASVDQEFLPLPSETSETPNNQQILAHPQNPLKRFFSAVGHKLGF